MAPGGITSGRASIFIATSALAAADCIGKMYREADRQRAYVGSPLTISKDERAKRKKRAKIAKASRKRNRR